MLLLDSLDEVPTYTGVVNVVQLLGRLEYLPASVRILAASRPDPRVLNLLAGARRLDLLDKSPDRRADVRAYVNEQLAFFPRPFDKSHSLT